VRVSSLVSIGPAVWSATRNIDTDKQTMPLLYRFTYLLTYLLSTTSCRVLDTFHQTYNNDALWEGQRRVHHNLGSKGQGHGGITYAGTITVQAEAYSSRRCVQLDFLVFNNCNNGDTLYGVHQLRS